MITGAAPDRQEAAITRGVRPQIKHVVTVLANAVTDANCLLIVEALVKQLRISVASTLRYIRCIIPASRNRE